MSQSLKYVSLYVVLILISVKEKVLMWPHRSTPLSW